jgi:hypothetical protein
MRQLRDLVQELEGLRATFGRSAAARKLSLLRTLASTPIRSADLLVRLHDSLLFLRAYPDSGAVLEAAEAGLRGFIRRVGPIARKDGEEFDALDMKGIAGTAIYCSFSLPVVRWLVKRYPGQVELLQDAEGVEERLGETLPRLLLPAEVEAVEDGYVGPLEWLRRTAGSRRGDALLRLLAMVDALPIDDDHRAALWAALDVPVRFSLATSDGSRTLCRTPMRETIFQKGPLDRSRVDLLAELRQPPYDVVKVPQAEAALWIEAARACMPSRQRELHSFTHASAEDLWMAEAGEGLHIALYGVLPEARHALRTFWGFLIARNDIPIGYGDAVLLFDWGELNFNVFGEFRQVGSARIYAMVLRVFRHHFGMRYLFLNRYQFGHHNEEAIQSGAFWFYEKLGFRPRDPHLTRLWKAERHRIARDPAYRTPPPVLRRLAQGHMALPLETPGHRLEHLYGNFHPMHVGLAVSRHVEKRYRGDRAAAESAAFQRVHQVVGGIWTGAEETALARVAPILDLVHDLESWTQEERAGLADLIRAKAAPQEREYLLLTQQHRRVRDALLARGRARR